MAKIIKFNEISKDEILYFKAKEAYYNGNPILSDADFDTLEDNLRSVDSFVVDVVGTVTIKKDSVQIGKLKNVAEHKTPMGSLAKIQFKKDYVPFAEFFAWLVQIANNIECLITFEPKLDGNAINCIYENGQLINVLSRGDGQEGQSYLKLFLNKVPQFIKNFTGEIRGEAVIDQYVFETKYKKDGIDPNKKYSNARNFVAGALTKGELQFTNDIDFIAFEIVSDEIYETKKSLINWGFEILDFTQELMNHQLSQHVFEKTFEKFVEYRKTCKYQLDGVVAKMDKSIRETIGGNSHHPFWALAIKFIAENVTTKIIGIDYSLTKKGYLAPVALLQPVQLMDSEVKRASVYNASWMIENNCYTGAEVSLVKSGDIIPKIVSIINPSTDKFEFPTEWNGLKVNFDGVQLCVEGYENSDEFKALKLHNSIIALGIKEIGPATAERLNKCGLDLKQLLSLNPDRLRSILIANGEFKDGRELELLIKNLFALTKVELWQVIYAMQYENCGRTISKQLANWMVGVDHDFKGLEKKVVENFINNTTAQNEVKELVGILLDNNVEVIKPKKISSDIITFEMSGSAGSFGTKEDYVRLVQQSGKCMHTSLSKTTNYLIVESLAQNTTKMQKAQKNGTQVIEYQQFYDYIKTL